MTKQRTHEHNRMLSLQRRLTAVERELKLVRAGISWAAQHMTKAHADCSECGQVK